MITGFDSRVIICGAPVASLTSGVRYMPRSDLGRNGLPDPRTSARRCSDEVGCVSANMRHRLGLRTPPGQGAPARLHTGRVT